MTIAGGPCIVGNVSDDTTRPLGDWLRQRREELEISLEQAQADTRIRPAFLEALEIGDMDSLPNPVVARGFLRNYATYLELDVKEALSRYAEAVGPFEQEPPPSDEPSPFESGPFRPVPLHKMPSGQTGRWWLVGLVVILLAAIGVLAWFGYPYLTEWLSQRGSIAEATPTRRATEAIVVLTSTETPTPEVTETATPSTVSPSAASPSTATPARATPTLAITLSPTSTPLPSPLPSPQVYTGIFVELVLTDTSWIQVTVDGVREFQGELEAGTYRSWYGRERVELRLGNAGAVEVTVNGEKLGTLGEVGDVVDRIFEIVGDQVSEATPNPEPSGTITAEVTLPQSEGTITLTLPITASATVTATGIPTTTAAPTASP